MGVSVKVALLMCIAFTTGVCWLVNQVSRQRAGPPVVHRSPTTLMSTTSLPPIDKLKHPSVSNAADENRKPPEPVTLAQAPSATQESTVLPPIRKDLEPAPPAASGETSAGTFAVREPIADPGASRDTVPPPPAPALPATAEYVVAKGDSLSRICKRTYGDDTPAIHKAIFELNPKLAKRPNCVYLGEVIQLPSLASMNGAVRAPAINTPTSTKESPTIAEKSKPGDDSERRAPRANSREAITKNAKSVITTRTKVSHAPSANAAKVANAKSRTESAQSRSKNTKRTATAKKPTARDAAVAAGKNPDAATSRGAKPAAGRNSGTEKTPIAARKNRREPATSEANAPPAAARDTSEKSAPPRRRGGTVAAR